VVIIFTFFYDSRFTKIANFAVIKQKLTHLRKNFLPNSFVTITLNNT